MELMEHAFAVARADSPSPGDMVFIVSGLVVGVSFAILFLVYQLIYMPRKIRAFAQEWATRNSYQVIDYRRKLFWWGPFTWASMGQHQQVVRMKTKDADGVMHTFWLKFGHALLLKSVDDIKVIEEKQPPNPASSGSGASP